MNECCEGLLKVDGSPGVCPDFASLSIVDLFGSGRAMTLAFSLIMVDEDCKLMSCPDEIDVDIR